MPARRRPRARCSAFGGRFSTHWDLFETIYKEATGGGIKEAVPLVQGEITR